MAGSASNAWKKLIRIDVISNSVCPWCDVGTKNLNKALALSKDKYNFEIKWHPFLLNPSAPKKGLNKSKFGPGADHMIVRMWSELGVGVKVGTKIDCLAVFRRIGSGSNMPGLPGSSLDSNRLILFAGKQGIDKQHKLFEEIFKGCFTQGKFIGDRDFHLAQVAAKYSFETFKWLAI